MLIELTKIDPDFPEGSDRRRQRVPFAVQSKNPLKNGDFFEDKRLGRCQVINVVTLTGRQKAEIIVVN